ncbi:MAG: SDR family NAD(P)-dependent oxidoreductase [Geobacter sp.]|jgi:NADP-dependent 3-hydroxy acid dehydrogenase YdfG|uniref:SDR family NAD(P)-dependent oxidoreductase n=1 Tax=Trichlorobacter sp. TaxID=2911007 RepID=UPI002A366446|nr:SDR family NAD(P)-dependent oxidoreductase [Trichlorobacter sp.]MDY0383565.1 SDR family NAD(P)-dependent oxidoreductase [Trichlorobacter sp.]
MRGKTILITGASSGFGAAAARIFAEEGNRLVVAARRLEPLLALQQELADRVQVLPLVLDVRERTAVEAAVASLPAGFSEIDLLVNNAGLALGLEPAQQASLDDWDTMVDTNIKGLTYMTRCLLPGMVARNRGHIINIGSTAGAWPYAGGNVYGGTKAFVEQFSRNLRTDLLGTMVRVTCIAPGMAETEFSQIRFKGDQQKAGRVYEGCQPLTAEDVAGIIKWVSDQPTHVNVNHLEVMTIHQAWGPLAVHRTNP